MFDGPGPIYLQIAESIRQEILAGSIGEGEQVMSTTQYAATYRINPATAAKAFAELVAEGTLFKQRGVGMFVAEHARADLLARRRESFLAEKLDPLLDEATLLGISISAIVRHVEAARSSPHHDADTAASADTTNNSGSRGAQTKNANPHESTTQERA